MEQKLVDLDIEIKKAVNFQKPNMELCIHHLKELQVNNVGIKILDYLGPNQYGIQIMNFIRMTILLWAGQMDRIQRIK